MQSIMCIIKFSVWKVVERFPDRFRPKTLKWVVVYPSVAFHINGWHKDSSVLCLYTMTRLGVMLCVCGMAYAHKQTNTHTRARAHTHTCVCVCVCALVIEHLLMFCYYWVCVYGSSILSGITTLIKDLNMFERIRAQRDGKIQW